MAHGLPIAIREIGDNAHFVRAFARFAPSALAARFRVAAAPAEQAYAFAKKSPQ
jgi:hypothetical protein